MLTGSPVGRVRAERRGHEGHGPRRVRQAAGRSRHSLGQRRQSLRHAERRIGTRSTVNDGSDRVVFSYLGYADQSVPYQKGADVDVKMLADGHYGDQTIHMGYTDQKLKDVSGAVSVVTGDELRKSPVASLSQALTGRLTGPLSGRVPVRTYARETLCNRTRTPHPELQHDAAGSHRRYSVLV